MPMGFSMYSQRSFFTIAMIDAPLKIDSQYTFGLNSFIIIKDIHVVYRGDKDMMGM
jgi:hypothetical protein